MTNIKLGSFVADFSQVKRFKAEIFPSSPIIGQKFQITVWAIENYQIQSAYGTVLSKIKRQSAEEIEIIRPGEILSFPVKKIISKNIANPILSKISRDVVYDLTDPPPNDDLRDDLVGSLKIRYVPVDRQIFVHSALNNPGDYLLYAIDDNGCVQEIHFSVAENSSAEPSLSLQAHDRTLEFGKFAVRLLPPSNDIYLKVSSGLLEETISQLVDIKEVIEFNAEQEKSASYPIESTPDIQANFFLDDADNFISLNISISGRKIKLSQRATGQIAIAYKTSARLFNYTPPPFSGGLRKFGIILATNKKTHAKASFDTFVFNSDTPGDSEAMLIVSRDVVVQGKNRFEMPPLWETNNTYPSYPSALVDDKPVIGDAFAVETYEAEIVVIERGSVTSYYPPVIWYKPTTGEAFADVKWKLTDLIPAAPTETIDAAMIAQLQTRRAELLVKYPGLS